MERTYLFVPPEENAEVEALGARRDAASKCWYIGPDEDRSRFSKWLPEYDEEDEERLAISSEHAYVASATVPCWKCRTPVEVICIYCESGNISDEPLTRFVINHISAMDANLAVQLERWRGFRRGPTAEDERFENHCQRCGAPQEGSCLDSEPGDPFFDIPHAPPGAIKLTPLAGRIWLSGDVSFGD